MRSCSIYLCVISMETFMISAIKMCLKITHFKLQSLLPGSNALNSHRPQLACGWDIIYGMFLLGRIGIYDLHLSLLGFWSKSYFNRVITGLLSDTKHCGLRMRRECWERLPRRRRLAIPTCITARASLAIPTCITARAWRTCRDTCQHR